MDGGQLSSFTRDKSGPVLETCGPQGNGFFGGWGAGGAVNASLLWRGLIILPLFLVLPVVLFHT